MPAFQMRGFSWQPIFLFGIFLFSMGQTGCHSVPQTASVSPPIILITLDTTRRDALSVYNSQVETTPHFGDFAKTATVFDRAYATAPWTLPSHSSMFSGLFPSRHQAGVSKAKFSSEVQTLPVLLKSKGYRSSGFSGGHFTNSTYGLANGFDEFVDKQGNFHRADQIVDKAKGFIKRAKGDSFFLFMNFFDAHAPYHPPLPFQKRFGLPQKREVLETLPRWKEAFGGYGLSIKKLRTMGVPEPHAVDYIQAAYASEVAFVDHHFGRLMSFLKRQGLFEKALIIVLADHGEYLGENGRYFHSYSLDPVLTHIPLLVKWPGQQIGKRNEALVSQVDIFSTVLETGGLNIPKNDGISLKDVTVDLNRWVLMEEHELKPIHPLYRGQEYIADDVYGIQTTTARGMIWEGQNQCERWEKQSWVQTSCGHDWKEDLAFIQQFLNVDPSDPDVPSDLDEHEQEVLRSLGYIQ